MDIKGLEIVQDNFGSFFFNDLFIFVQYVYLYSVLIASMFTSMCVVPCKRWRRARKSCHMGTRNQGTGPPEEQQVLLIPESPFQHQLQFLITTFHSLQLVF